MSNAPGRLDELRNGPPFRLGEFRVEPGLDRLVGPGGEVALEPRAMDLLLFLASHRGQTLSKEELIDEVWRGAAVVEGVLPKAISALRHALGDDPVEPRYILTVPRRGYRLLADAAADAAGKAPAEDAQQTTAPVAAPPPELARQSGVPRGRLAAGIVVLVVAGLLAAALAGRARLFRSAPAEAPASSAISSPEVEKVLLEARQLWTRRNPADLRRALDLLRRAAAEAPESAEVRGWLAIVEVTESNYVGDTPRGLVAAEEQADAALRLDPRSAVAHAAKGLVAINRRLAIREAVEQQRRAVELDSRFVVARQYFAEALSAQGRNDEALAQIDEALRLEPLSPVLHGVKGLILLCADRPLAALEAFDRVLVLAPQFGWFQRYRAYALTRLGRTREAAAAFIEELVAIGETQEQLARARARIDESGLDGYWSWRIERLEGLRREGLEPRPTQLAEALAGVRRYEEAVAALQRAPAEADGEYFLYYRQSPAFDAIREDPEFVALYDR